MRIRIITLLLIAIAIIGCKKNIGNYTPQEGPIAVETMILDGEGTNGISHSYVGTCEAQTKVNLSFATGGKITKVAVKSGDRVQNGQVLAEVDNTQYKNAFEVAKATLEQAQDGYERAKKVYKEGGISEIKWKDIETQLSKAQSLANIAQENLNNCQLTAPFTGIIGDCNLTEGQQVIPGQSLIELMEINRLSIRFSVPENEISHIAIGQEITVTTAVDETCILKAKISEKSITANMLSHSYSVKADLTESNNNLLPGMVCKAIVSSRSTDTKFVIPASCIQIRPESKCVWLMIEGKAHRQLISTGEFVKNGVIVTEGLEAGDCIVIGGYQKLTEGLEIVQQ